MGIKYCCELQKPQGFEDMILMHGICALSRTDIVQGIKHAIKVLDDPTYESCCSTEAIGPVGLAVKADVITASNADLYTRVDHANGHRYFDADEENMRNLIFHAKDLAPNEYGINDEMVTVNHRLEYIWINTKIATEEETEAALWLAEQINAEVRYIEVEQKIEIWDDDYWM